MSDQTTKLSNPKDALGSNKLPLHLVPPIAIAQEALAFEYGMLQYGRSNWRGVGVRATIYVDAMLRHTFAYLEGEDRDPDSGLSHLAHIRACAAILLDAINVGNLTDDRQYPGNYRAGIDALTPEVKRLKELVGAMGKDTPHHYTIQDVVDKAPQTEKPDLLPGYALVCTMPKACRYPSCTCSVVPPPPRSVVDPRQACQLPERCGCDKCYAVAASILNGPSVDATLQIGDVVAVVESMSDFSFPLRVGDTGEVTDVRGAAIDVKFHGRGTVLINKKRLTLISREQCHCGPDGARSKCPAPGTVVPFKGRMMTFDAGPIPVNMPTRYAFPCGDCDSTKFCQMNRRCMRGQP